MTDTQLHQEICLAAEDLADAHCELEYIWALLGDPQHDYWWGYEPGQDDEDLCKEFDSVLERFATCGKEWEQAMVRLCNSTLQLIPGGLDA